MKRRNQETAFWSAVAVAGVTSLLFVATNEEPAIRVTVDDWQQQAEGVLVRATLENDLIAGREVTVAFMVDHWTNDWTASGYSFFGRGEHQFEIEGKGTRKIQVVIPILKRTAAKLHVSASVIGVRDVQTADAGP